MMMLKPRISEKAYNLSQGSSVYVFEVPSLANKITIADAVRDQFKVKVKTVNIIVSKGKAKRSSTKRNVIQGERGDIKKAYVTLMSGNTIPIFPAPEAQTKGGAK